MAGQKIVHYCVVRYNYLFVSFIITMAADTRTAILPTDISANLTTTYLRYLPFVNDLQENNTLINYGLNSTHSTPENFAGGARQDSSSVGVTNFPRTKVYGFMTNASAKYTASIFRAEE